MRTLIDSGSGANWITQHILAHVKHTILGYCHLRIETFNGVRPGRFQIVEVYYEDKSKEEQQSITCFVHDKFTKHVTVQGLVNFITRKCKTRKAFQNLVDPATKNVDHAEMDLGTGLILSTAGVSKMRAPQSNILLTEHDILIEHTIFGNAISGRVPDELKKYVKTIQALNITPIIAADKVVRHEELFPSDNRIPHADIEFLWNKENIGIMNDEVHSDVIKAWDKFQDSVKYDKESKVFTVGLPWNDKKHLLKSNKVGAAARTRRQQIIFIKEKETYGIPCVEAFKKLLAEDQVERVNMKIEPQGLEHYLPWRGIIKVESQTTKCRLVMDASAKASASEVSLNQCLYQGPNLILDLVFCLIKFMKGIYAAVSDIEKAFLKILIDFIDRDVLRFFFPEDPFNLNSRLLVYRFKVVMFGCISSPFLLAAVLEKLISEETRIAYVETAIRNGLFVDNSGFASDNVNKMIEFYKEARRVLNLGNFNLRQWSSNCKEVMELASADRVQCNEVTVKVLGLMWNIQDDMLSLQTDFKWNGKFTKRACLQFINAVYDPLNCLGPYAIRNRLFVQILWFLGYDWDESFEKDKELVNKWMKIVHDTEEIARARFRRRLAVQPGTEIHVFGDASKEAYGAVAYVRTPPGKDFPKGDTRFVVAKGKIVPKKGGPGNTIPKLELTAMKIAANLVVFCQKALEVPSDNRVIIWCDAQAVLSWVSDANLDNTFVHERVKQIRELCPTAEVRYVDTKNNPADIITREQKSPKDFLDNINWWQGPRWLLAEENWPKVEKIYKLHPELKVTTNIFHNLYDRTIAVNVAVNEVQVSFLKEFGKRDFKTSVKALAHVIRFINNAWPKKPDISPCKLRHFTTDHIGPDEFSVAQTLALKIMQREAFEKEIGILLKKKPIRTGPFANLDLFLDDQNIIRCRGRLEYMVSPELANAPVLVDTESPFTTAFIGYLHKCANCTSNNYTLHKVRQVMHGLK